MDITKDTTVEKTLAAYPALAKTFIEFSLPCFVCGEPYWGTIEDIAIKHNLNVEKIVEKLNEKKRKIDEKL